MFRALCLHAIRRGQYRGGASGRHRKPWHASIPPARSIARRASLPGAGGRRLPLQGGAPSARAGVVAGFTVRVRRAVIPLADRPATESLAFNFVLGKQLLRAASSQAARHFYERKTHQKTNRRSRQTRAGEAETSCPKKEDYMHANSTRNHRSTSEKIVADVVRVKTLTETEVRQRFALTLSDWTEKQQAAFAKAVVASHGWNYRK